MEYNILEDVLGPGPSHRTRSHRSPAGATGTAGPARAEASDNWRSDLKGNEISETFQSY